MLQEPPRLVDRVLVLGAPVDVVDVVGAVRGVVYPLPAVRQLVHVTVFQRLLLDERQPRVQPVRGARAVTAGVGGDQSALAGRW